jgi:2-oxoglutarate ferredoxin oxidoreductase subunit delta
MFVCPKDLFEPSGKMNQAGYLPPRVKDIENCTGCENCTIYCPDMAVVVEKEDFEETGANEEHNEQGR